MLRDLKLEGYMFPWRATTLPSLTNLHLTSFENPLLLPLSSILDLLVSLPLLGDVKLGGLCYHRGDIEPPDTSPVDLPNFKALSMRNAVETAVVYVMRHLKMDNLSTLTFGGISDRFFDIGAFLNAVEDYPVLCSLIRTTCNNSVRDEESERDYNEVIVEK